MTTAATPNVPTPRTDAAAFGYGPTSEADHVWADFARTLECELSAARQRIAGLEELWPWADDVALLGDEAPKSDGKVKHLIRYLQTVHKRFGNTAVTASVQWGASACWVRDDQKKLIADLESRLAEVRLATIEECAKVCEVHDCGDILAEAIRHLKEKS